MYLLHCCWLHASRVAFITVRLSLLTSAMMLMLMVLIMHGAYVIIVFRNIRLFQISAYVT